MLFSKIVWPAFIVMGYALIYLIITCLPEKE